MHRRQAEAKSAHAAARGAAVDDEVSVRQRVLADDDPQYEEYDTLVKKLQPPALPPPPSDAHGGSGVASTSASVAGGLPVPVEVPMHRRADGTPLDFASRDAKQEAIKQHKIEQMYAAEQAAWGLPVPAQPGAAPADAFGAAGARVAVPPPRGRGKHIVRPAWMTRQEQHQVGGREDTIV